MVYLRQRKRKLPTWKRQQIQKQQLIVSRDEFFACLKPLTDFILLREFLFCYHIVHSWWNEHAMRSYDLLEALCLFRTLCNLALKNKLERVSITFAQIKEIEIQINKAKDAVEFKGNSFVLHKNYESF